MDIYFEEILTHLLKATGIDNCFAEVPVTLVLVISTDCITLWQIQS